MSWLKHLAKCELEAREGHGAQERALDYVTVRLTTIQNSVML